ncbi:MAG: glycoside hydrolase family 130 protein [Syntrophomonadaceae bacterium]
MINHTKIELTPDPSRVLMQPFYPGSEKRVKNVLNRILNLDEKRAAELEEKVMSGFSGRHRNTPEIFENNFKLVGKYLDRAVTPQRRQLIGAYFSKEYSIESAALFNPSIVPHPEDPAGGRFIMSLRATGEGHISSIEFREGRVDKDEVTLEPYSKFLDAGELVSESNEDSYEIMFNDDVPVPERVLFPYLDSESHGMEDARFVRFENENAAPVYYATYTAYDGHKTSIGFIETKDFRQFKISRLMGDEVRDKGMALFPKKVGGRYMMISRQDGENLYIMDSDKIDTWNKKSLLKVPVFDWEFVQLGNCGSPLETKAGWLLLTHSVGPVRTYVMSAVLLDLNDPSKVTGYLPEALIYPTDKTREGYVPNVVYSCGSMLHEGRLIIPYAMADSASGVAIVDVDELLNRFIRVS